MPSTCHRRCEEEMPKRRKADSVTTVAPCSTPSPSLFHHERRTRERGNRTAMKLSHKKRRRASDLSPPVRPADPSTNHVAIRKTVSVAAAGGRHRSRRSTSVILLFIVSCLRLEALSVVAELLKLLAAVGAAAG
ncbi:uncharacterized protein DS421_1g11760 [Arachis hypogaea]|nr:uncharacterized protein DS421_1g11760 [Arachis hypogaea]